MEQGRHAAAAEWTMDARDITTAAQMAAEDVAVAVTRWGGKKISIVGDRYRRDHATTTDQWAVPWQTAA